MVTLDKRKMKEMTEAEKAIAALGLDEKNYPHLTRWEPEHLYRTLQGIAKASGGDLASAAQNLELDLSMM